MLENKKGMLGESKITMGTLQESVVKAFWQHVSAFSDEVQWLIRKGIITLKQAIAWEQQGNLEEIVGTLRHKSVYPLIENNVFSVCQVVVWGCKRTLEMIEIINHKQVRSLLSNNTFSISQIEQWGYDETLSRAGDY